MTAGSCLVVKYEAPALPDVITGKWHKKKKVYLSSKMQI